MLIALGATRQLTTRFLEMMTTATTKFMSQKPKTPNPRQPRTLDAARLRIEELEWQLSGKPMPTQKPGKTTAAAVKHIVSSNPGAVASLEAIQTELNEIDTPEARVRFLEKHVEAYRAQARAVKSCSVEQTELLRAAQRIELRLAYELRSDKVAWQSIRRSIPNI
jgi:hypothetical protein